MKPHPLITAALLLLPLTSLLFAGDVSIVGALSDGTPPQPAATKEPRAFEVLATTEQDVGGRKLIVQRVKPPLPPTEPAAAVKANVPAAVPLASPAVGEIPFALSATVVDHRATLLRWSHGGREYEAWSSVDFNHLTGFAAFRKGARQFAFTLGIGNSRAKDAPPVPEGLRFDVPAFMVIKGDPGNAAALEPVAALHDLYQSDGLRLRTAYQSREQRQRERAAERPAPPADILLRYWKVNGPARNGGAK
jgi:hypothetical protein